MVGREVIYPHRVAPPAACFDMSAQDWGYKPDNGPSTWAQRFPEAGGLRQSPVDIATALVSSDQTLHEEPLTWNYAPRRCIRLVNPGYGWRVDVDGNNTVLHGGPLSGEYKLEQFHCHWGKTSDEGSEHTVDGKAYAGELHLVHWNCTRYSSFQEAARYPDGLAVLGIFLQVGENLNPQVKKITNMIPNIIHKGQTFPISDQIEIGDLIPSSGHYWTYLGSLTTPPCSECVIWIVFKKPIQVSEDELAVFRTMKSVGEEENIKDDECRLVHNYRPPLPLGNRILRECGSV